MLFTNGKILMSQDNNKEVLNHAADKVEKYVLDEKGLKVKFEESKEHFGFALIIPDDVSFDTLSFLLSATPGIQFKAINQKEIILATTDRINVRYTFTMDELKELAVENMEKQIELERLEAQKKRSMDEYKTKIQVVEERIKETRDSHMHGSEDRDYDCIVKLNIDERKKYFIDKYDGTTIRKVEDFSKRDYQTFINHRFEGTMAIEFSGGEGTKENPLEVTLKDKLLGENEEEEEETESEEKEEFEEEEDGGVGF